MASCPLNALESVRVVDAIDELRKKIGPPGDYGYESRLGIILNKLYDVAGELRKNTALATQEQ